MDPSVANPTDNSMPASEPSSESPTAPQEMTAACMVAACDGAMPASFPMDALPSDALLSNSGAPVLPESVLASAVVMPSGTTTPVPASSLCAETVKRGREPGASSEMEPKAARLDGPNPQPVDSAVSVEAPDAQAAPQPQQLQPQPQILLVPAMPAAVAIASSQGLSAGASFSTTAVVAGPASSTRSTPAGEAQPQQGGGGSAPMLVAPAMPLQGGQWPAMAGHFMQGYSPWGMMFPGMMMMPGNQMMMQWMPTAAMATADGGMPVRVVCRGCGLVRFDVEGRRWVHNHRQGKGNKQYVCNRVMCGCQKGQICPTRGQPHDPIPPACAVAVDPSSSQSLPQSTSSLPPVISGNGASSASSSSLPPVASTSGLPHVVTTQAGQRRVVVSGDAGCQSRAEEAPAAAPPPALEAPDPQ